MQSRNALKSASYQPRPGSWRLSEEFRLPLAQPTLKKRESGMKALFTTQRKLLPTLISFRIAELYEYALLPEHLLSTDPSIYKTTLTDTGALHASSGVRYGRSPKDKRVVLDEVSKDVISCLDITAFTGDLVGRCQHSHCARRLRKEPTESRRLSQHPPKSKRRSLRLTLYSSSSLTARVAGTPTTVSTAESSAHDPTTPSS